MNKEKDNIIDLVNYKNKDKIDKKYNNCRNKIIEPSISKEEFMQSVVDRIEILEEIKEFLKDLVLIGLNIDEEISNLDISSKNYEDDYYDLYKKKMLSLTLYSLLSFSMLQLQLFEERDSKVALKFFEEHKKNIINSFGEDVYKCTIKYAKILKSFEI